jgi:hypothetical protein
MTQVIVFLDNKQNEIIENFSKFWHLSKQETIRKMIDSFEDKLNGCVAIN